jgi:hypothetical protein
MFEKGQNANGISIWKGDKMFRTPPLPFVLYSEFIFFVDEIELIVTILCNSKGTCVKSI